MDPEDVLTEETPNNEYRQHIFSSCIVCENEANWMPFNLDPNNNIFSILATSYAMCLNITFAWDTENSVVIYRHESDRTLVCFLLRASWVDCP